MAPLNRTPSPPRHFAALFAFAAALSALSSTLALAQADPPDPAPPVSLDEAVNAQLEFLNIACERLLNGDGGQLGQLGTTTLATICSRGPGGGTSAAAGNGAASGAAAMPEAVRRRLKDESLGATKPLRGVFGTVMTGPSDRKVTRFQDGYEGDVSGLLGGYDREFGKWVAGFTAEYWTQKGDFTGGGDFETTSIGPTGYASLALDDKSDLAFYAGYNSVSNDRVRHARFAHVLSDNTVVIAQNGRPAADFDADEFLAGAQCTYRWSKSNVSLVPKIALDWKNTHFDDYRETETTDSGLALAFHGDERTSLLATIGVDASASLSTDFGVIVVAEHLNRKHEFQDDQRTVRASFIDDPRNQVFRFQTEPPDRDYRQVGIDVILILQGGLQFYLGYEQIASHRYLETGTVSLGMRKEF
jgi:outer membrane autotransporter protein